MLHGTARRGTAQPSPPPTWQQVCWFRWPLYVFLTLRVWWSHSSSRLSSVPAGGGWRSAGIPRCDGSQEGGRWAGPTMQADGGSQVSRYLPLGVKRTQDSAGLALSVRLASQRPVAASHTRLRRAGGKAAGLEQRKQAPPSPADCALSTPQQVGGYAREAVKGAARDVLVQAGLPAEGHPRHRV